MMELKLTPQEQELILNREWLLMKQRIIEKVCVLFGELSAEYRQLLAGSTFPEELARISPKVSRGENHHGLPYVMLDFPRIFGKEDVFAIRSFFWWGKGFSIHLHLQGKYLHQYREEVLKTGEKYGWWISNHSAPWEHDFEHGGYMPLKQHAVSDDGFLKIGRLIAPDQWEHAAFFYRNAFQELMRLPIFPHQKAEGAPL